MPPPLEKRRRQYRKSTLHQSGKAVLGKPKLGQELPRCGYGLVPVTPEPHVQFVNGNQPLGKNAMFCDFGPRHASPAQWQVNIAKAGRIALCRSEIPRQIVQSE